MSLKQHNRPPKKPPTPPTAGCRECGKPLTTPATVKRRMCRSCWRVAKVVSTP